MDYLAFAARLALALVFLVSGVAKLSDRAGSRRALADFGVPQRLAQPLGVALPLAELALAIGLLPTVAVRWSAAGILALLLVFMGGISYNLARGRTPNCHCFGVLSSTPASERTLVRNGILALMAVVVIWTGASAPVAIAHPTGTALSGLLLAVQLVMLVVLGGAVWLLLQMLRQQGRMLERLASLEALKDNGVPASETQPQVAQPLPPQVHSLPVGSQAPTFTATDLRGKAVALEGYLEPEKLLLLLFVDPDCGACESVLSAVQMWQSEEMAVLVISRGDIQINRARATRHGIPTLVMQAEREIIDLYSIRGTPSAVLLDGAGVVLAETAEGQEAIRALVARYAPAPARSRRALEVFQ